MNHLVKSEQYSDQSSLSLLRYQFVDLTDYYKYVNTILLSEPIPEKGSAPGINIVLFFPVCNCVLAVMLYKLCIFIKE